MKFCIEKSVFFLEKQVKELLEEKGHEISERGITLAYEETEKEEYKAAVTGDSITVTAGSRACFFRGLAKAVLYLEEENRKQAMKDMSEIREILIREEAHFTTCGAMLDCSRNAVLKVESLKGFIRKMAQLGMNCLMLYMEDTYEIPEYPYFGSMRGRYTRQELKECDNYAYGFGIELIPCVQTLAHLHTPLRFPVFQEYRDTEDVLLVGDEKVYELIEAMIRSLSQCFRSHKIHLGMDEAHGLGLGEYLRKHGYHERFELMNSHLLRVKEICDRYNLSPAIWSDMYFRLLSPTGDYYDIPWDIDKETMVRPPEGVELVYWDYYHDEEEVYEHYFKLHGCLAKQFSFAGGGWTWNGLAPNYSKMLVTTEAALKSCRKLGIDTAVCTFWQDNGAETSMKASAPALALYGEYCYQEGEHPEESGEFKNFFAYLFGNSWDDYMVLDRFDHVPGVLPHNLNADNPSKYFLYQDSLAGMFEVHAKAFDTEHYYKELKRELKEIADRTKSPLFDYYVQLAKVLTVKAGLGRKILTAYEEQNKKELKEISTQRIRRCLVDLEELLIKRRQLWFEECKPFGFELLDIRFGGVIARLKSTQIRLNQFLSGETDRLEELEEERLAFGKDQKNPDHRQCSCPFWENIISAGNMTGV